jgi:hypothetical protein
MVFLYPGEMTFHDLGCLMLCIFFCCVYLGLVFFIAERFFYDYYMGIISSAIIIPFLIIGLILI